MLYGALLALHHLGHEEVHHVYGAPEVDVEDPLPVVQLHLLEPAAAANARVAAQDVHVVPLLEELLAERLDLFGAGVVDEVAACLHALAFQLLDDFVYPLLDDVGHDDLRAARIGQLVGEGSSDA